MKLRTLLVVSLLACACDSLPPRSDSGRASTRADGPARGAAPESAAIGVETETYTLPNGMTVVLHEDHSLPKAVINTWFGVGSKDEAPGRTGFAHLFEHLMFMGTGRVPDNQFDVLMESGGGSNNATTNTDRTNYYSMGPSSLLPTLLWLDADRLDALADHMTQEKLDLQRAVVRNERRQSSENVPYGKAWLMLPALMYPEGHPYHHSVIGSHEDLEAATLQDVIDFFHTYYVPGNASLVVAGDFDSARVKEVIAQTFGAIPAKPVPTHRDAQPFALTSEVKAIATDRVEFPKLYLVWHSPRYYRTGDGAMDVIGALLSGGPSSRLERRLVLETGLAQEVQAYQVSRELGSQFHVEAVAAPGADLEEIKREVLTLLDELATGGPSEEELERVRAQMESAFLSGMESLLSRADNINAYRHYFGVSDGFQRDLDRWTKLSAEDVRSSAAAVFGEGRVDLRIYPEGAAVAEASLDRRPTDFAAPAFTPPLAETFTLSNGIEVHAVARPGTRLFSGRLLLRGGESLLAGERAGHSSLGASLLESGAGGLDASAFASAVDSLGASIGASGGREQMTIRVSGLTSRMKATLDRFADVVLRPNLAPEDFEREQKLALAGIAARNDNPRAVAGNVARILTFGADDARGRPVDGSLASIEAATLDGLKGSLARLVHPANATFVFAGDFTIDTLRAELERRFGSWRSKADATLPARQPVVTPPAGRMVLVDRPGAPQTVVYVLRPVPPADGAEQAARECVDVVFGGTFTSRLNANLREKNGYSYGASSRVRQEGIQHLMLASSSVRTDVTGAALTELKKEFDSLASGNVTPDELAKATETLRGRIVEESETTRALAGSLASIVTNARPIDAAARDLEALGQVDDAAALAAATSGLYRWDELLIVLVGDEQAVLPQLAAAGFAPPLEATADGELK